MKEVFISQENENYDNYDIRSGTHATCKNMHTAYFGTDTMTNLGPKLWKLVPDKIKNTLTLSVFKSRIKIWTTDNYPRRQITAPLREKCPNTGFFLVRI